MSSKKINVILLTKLVSRMVYYRKNIFVLYFVFEFYVDSCLGLSSERRTYHLNQSECIWKGISCGKELEDKISFKSFYHFLTASFPSYSSESMLSRSMVSFKSSRSGWISSLALICNLSRSKMVMKR